MNYPIEAATALSPEDVIGLVEFQTPREVISVRGRVDSLTPWTNGRVSYVYGTLSSSGSESALKFRCTPDVAPRAVTQHVVISGVLKCVPSKLQPGSIDVFIWGNCVGEFYPQAAPKSALDPYSRATKIDLAEYFQKARALDKALIVGSKTAINDLKKEAGATHSFPLCESISMSDIDILVEVVQSKKPDILIITRGGDDRGIAFWDSVDVVERLLRLNIPFYTALGHSHRLTLADHYADQAFITPTAIGGAIKSIFERMRSTDELSENYKNSQDEVSQLKHALIKAEVNQEKVLSAALESWQSKTQEKINTLQSKHQQLIKSEQEHKQREIQSIKRRYLANTCIVGLLAAALIAHYFGLFAMLLAVLH